MKAHLILVEEELEVLLRLIDEEIDTRSSLEVYKRYSGQLKVIRERVLRALQWIALNKKPIKEEPCDTAERQA